MVLKLIEKAPVNRTKIFKPILHICPRLNFNSNEFREKIWIEQVNVSSILVIFSGNAPVSLF